MSKAPEKALFDLVSPFSPTGDQPEAIRLLSEGVARGDAHQVLLGITGSGKTFTVANVIRNHGRPALIMAPNKTLAAQLYGEFKALFPNNAVHYFVSYYDYYQPEAYVASTDTFIEKDSMVNEEIDRMRHAATYALLSREDVIIIASVSCIYGIGSRSSYSSMTCDLAVNQELPLDCILRRLVELQYTRNDTDFHRGTFRVRGDTIEVFPAYEYDTAIRIEFWGDTVEAISEIDPLRAKHKRSLDQCSIFPASHYATPAETLKRAVKSIQEELATRLQELSCEEKLVERQRLEQRTLYDIECIEQMGFCSGIENYSRHLDDRSPNQAPQTLIDYFPKGSLIIIDESHQTVPQVGAMFKGDRSRKETLVGFGFRLPSALDNRPLRFAEWEERIGQAIHVSATPGDYEIEKAKGVVVEQLIRPTGLLDPVIEVRPVGNQVDDLLEEIRVCAKKKQRVLVTTLTKRMSEDLSEYYSEIGVRIRYLHSDIDTLARMELITDLRRGEYDVLVGINLLREGLDIPEVSLVAILDADKEGFLRSRRSLIQTMGRAARNVDGRVILYADKITASMRLAIDETERRREVQAEHNLKHGITPTTVRREILTMGGGATKEKHIRKSEEIADQISRLNVHSAEELNEAIAGLRKEMREAADTMDYERASELRDKAANLEELRLAVL